VGITPLRRRALAIALGGIAGATLRWVVLAATEPGAFPWPVLALNVVGSTLVGALLAEQHARPADRWWLHDAGALGFCGGLTTFSTFAVEVVQLIRDGRVEVAVVYLAASVAGAIAGAACGCTVWRRVRSA
jgi:CrcB protein